MASACHVVSFVRVKAPRITQCQKTKKRGKEKDEGIHLCASASQRLCVKQFVFIQIASANIPAPPYQSCLVSYRCSSAPQDSHCPPSTRMPASPPHPRQLLHRRPYNPVLP